MEKFDGLTPLETFLAKFQNYSDYYDWNARERLCHLRASLDGEAGQVLWTDGELNSAEDVIQLLRNRFGNQDQRERYRAELKTIRRRRFSSVGIQRSASRDGVGISGRESRTLGIVGS